MQTEVRGTAPSSRDGVGVWALRSWGVVAEAKMVPRALGP